jgi:hypothetical protein
MDGWMDACMDMRSLLTEDRLVCIFNLSNYTRVSERMNTGSEGAVWVSYFLTLLTLHTSPFVDIEDTARTEAII